MSDPLEDLERELRSYRPRDLPEERWQALTAPRQMITLQPRRKMWFATLAAASVVAALTIGWALHKEQRERQRTGITLAQQTNWSLSTAPPTVEAYQRAFMQSPEALDQLLARHNTELLQPVPGETQFNLRTLQQQGFDAQN